MRDSASIGKSGRVGIEAVANACCNAGEMAGEYGRCVSGAVAVCPGNEELVSSVAYDLTGFGSSMAVNLVGGFSAFGVAELQVGTAVVDSTGGPTPVFGVKSALTSFALMCAKVRRSEAVGSKQLRTLALFQKGGKAERAATGGAVSAKLESDRDGNAYAPCSVGNEKFGKQVAAAVVDVTGTKANVHRVDVRGLKRQVAGMGVEARAEEMSCPVVGGFEFVCRFASAGKVEAGPHGTAGRGQRHAPTTVTGNNGKWAGRRVSAAVRVTTTVRSGMIAGSEQGAIAVQGTEMTVWKGANGAALPERIDAAGLALRCAVAPARTGRAKAKTDQVRTSAMTSAVETEVEGVRQAMRTVASAGKAKAAGQRFAGRGQHRASTTGTGTGKGNLFGVVEGAA